MSRRRRKRRPRGTGSVFQRSDGRWCGEISLGYELGGARRKIVVYGKNPDEAQTLLTEEITRYRRGDRPAGKYTHETVQTFLARWIEDGCRAGARQKTNYRTSIARIDKAIGHLRLDRVTPETVDAYVAAQNEKGLGPRSVEHDWQTLHAAFACAVRWELLARNPADKTKKPAYEAAERQALDLDRARKFIEHAQRDALAALWLLALGTGMRPSEVCRFERDRVDLPARAVRVARKGTKTRAGVRTLPLPQFVVDALREHQKALLANGLAASPYLFPRGLAQRRSSKSRLEQLDRFAIRVLWANFREQLGDAVPPGFAFKDLRHAYSSLLKAAGAHPTDHQYLMGHSDYEITSKVYTHEIGDERRALADRLQALLVPPVSSECEKSDA